jgi:hypothetical protein
MNMLKLSICVAACLVFAQTARAQVPFFNGTPTAFTPQISIVNSGALLDAQAVVSSDRKHVTLNMRPQNSTLLALRSFTFQNGQNGNFPGGNVGDPPANIPPGRSDDPSTAVHTSPTEILERAKSQASVLHRSGMSRISLLKD